MGSRVPIHDSWKREKNEGRWVALPGGREVHSLVRSTRYRRISSEYRVYSKIYYIWKNSWGLENFSRFLFWSFFRKKREREREMYVSREGSRSILEYLSRNFWNWKFWNRCFKVVSDFYQAVWFFWEMEEFWTEVYGNCIGTVCERLKLLSKGYSFWMVFIVLSFILKIFGIECSNRIEKFSKDILQFSFITLFYNFEKRYHTIFKLDI